MGKKMIIKSKISFVRSIKQKMLFEFFVKAFFSTEISEFQFLVKYEIKKEYFDTFLLTIF